MKLSISLLLIGVFTLSLGAPVESDNVDLIIHGEEADIPEDMLGIKVNKYMNGERVNSEKLFPSEKQPEVLPEIPQIPENPVIPENPDIPINPEVPENPETPKDPGSPEDPETPEDSETPEDPDTPENPESPDNPGVVPPIGLPESSLPVADSNVVYKDDMVSVEVNADESLWTKLSSWVSVMMKWVSGSEEDTVKVL